MKGSNDLGYKDLVNRVLRQFARSFSQDIQATPAALGRLEARNRSSKVSVLSSDGPVVSLTSYGRRIESVYLTLESIAAGTRLPSRLILWVDDKAAFNGRPDTLRRLEGRGLEVKLTENLGPHTKYYPYLESQQTLDRALVTADDDTLYPARWLKGLIDNLKRYPLDVSCYRAHKTRLIGTRMADYITWPRCISTKPSFCHFATGVSGVIYPPEFQQRLKTEGKGFCDVCPKADDVWLHAQALRGGFKIRQIRPWEQTFPVLPGTQEMGLVQENVYGSQNDIQIRSTYTSVDIEMLSNHCN